MSWHAKPSGGYATHSTEGEENILEIYNYLYANGYTDEAACGVIGNMISESALNPWRWQSETYNLSGGYGLFQYTPASGYINGAQSVPYYAPNLSTSQVTTGAQATDGLAQLYVMDTNYLHKWVSTCWRSYWSRERYPEEYQLRRRILELWGNGATLSMSQYRLITDLRDATFAFLACFEGPARIHLNARYTNAVDVYRFITGQDPQPSPTIRKGLPIWMMIRYHF